MTGTPTLFLSATRPRFALLAFTVLCSVRGLLAAGPVVIWASDPVRPGETVVVRGDGLGSTARVEVAPGGNLSSWQPVEVVQQTDRTLKFILPGTIPTGTAAFRITAEGTTSPAVLLNEPELWWTQGDETDAATPGGWIRVFGLNLDFRGPATVELFQNGRRVAEVFPRSRNAYNFEVPLPSTLEPGDYDVNFFSGENTPSGRIKLGRIKIVARQAATPPVFDVTDFGAVQGQPDTIQYTSGMKAPDQVDSTAAVQKALDAAGSAGGGIVTFPRGIFVLSRGLTVPAGVTLRGAGQALTALSWIDEDERREKEDLNKLTWGSLLYKPVREPGSAPHPFLIKGPGHFAVEDMAIYAINHTAGIVSGFPDTAEGAGHVKIRRVVMRLDRFLNVQENSRHYTNSGDVYLQRLAAEPQRGATWQGAIHLSGPNIEITDCDLYSSLSVIVLNGASGLIARNRIAAVPKHWTVLGRKTHRMIFEENECLNGGISLLNVHNTAAQDTHTGPASIFSRELYCGNNALKDSYLKDRDGGFISDFHAPVGIYAGWAASSNGASTTLAQPAGGTDLSKKWEGAMVSVVDGKGAGQIRFMRTLDGTRLEVDEPWQVSLDATSFLTISKTLYRGLFVDNAVADAGNAVSLWGGGVEMVIAGNRSDRGGSFNQITLCHGDQFIPCVRAQFLDNVIAGGISWGAAYIFPRGSVIGAFTYTPLAFERVIQKNRGKPVTAPDYSGPLAIDQIFRRNRIENNGCFYVGGLVGNVLFEDGFIAHSRLGVDIRETGGRWDDALFEVGPSDILIRNNTMEDVTTPYAGDFLKNALILPIPPKPNS